MKKTVALALVSLVLSILAAEVGFRWLLFGSGALGESQRDPGLYGDYFSEDFYWKLYRRFGGPHRAPRDPHPLLGWVGPFSRDDYLHDEAAAIGDRRPVLLYGDSYARCVPGELCFEILLNSDQAFSEGHYLLNYGVGGYGFDQIYLLLRESLDLYEEPFVVIGLLTFDIDRSLLTVRTGQKPRFQIEDDRLELDRTPIEPDAAAFFARNPPRTPSYLFRRLIYSKLLPRPVREQLRGEHAFRQAKMELTRKIFEALLAELERRQVDFVFLVFHTEYPGVSELAGRDDWRDRFLRQLLDELEVPYVWSKEIVAADMVAGGRGPEAYIHGEHRHPTTRYNRLLAAEIKRYSTGE